MGLLERDARLRLSIADFNARTRSVLERTRGEEGPNPLLTPLPRSAAAAGDESLPVRVVDENDSGHLELEFLYGHQGLPPYMGSTSRM